MKMKISNFDRITVKVAGLEGIKAIAKEDASYEHRRLITIILVEPANNEDIQLAMGTVMRIDRKEIQKVGWKYGK